MQNVRADSARLDRGHRVGQRLVALGEIALDVERAAAEAASASPSRRPGAAAPPTPYERLMVTARSVDPRSLLVVLLGAEAGLRGGEIVALKFKHCDRG